MARIAKRTPLNDGDSIIAVDSDKTHDIGRIRVIPGGKLAYVTVEANTKSFVCFSGQRTLQRLARAILKACR